jgi:8-oxo-dGTP diphosphatase
MLSGPFVLLCRRPECDHLAGHWELPGGKIEPGETPEDCLARELLEECSIEAEIGELFAENTHRYPHATIRLLAFRVESWSGELRLHAHDEHRWVPLSEVNELPLAPADVPILTKLRAESEVVGS